MYDIFRIDNDLYEINERDDNEQYSICKKTDIGIYNYGKELDMAIAEILKGYKILFRIKQNSLFDGESEVIIFECDSLARLKRLEDIIVFLVYIIVMKYLGSKGKYFAIRLI